MTRVQRYTSVIATSPFLIVLLGASFFKVSFIIGSKMAFFSGLDMLSPLLGGLGGFMPAAFFFIGRSLVHPFSFFTSLLRHIPGFCGAWYWSSQSFVIRVIVPVACMLLFWLHPVGSQAYAYAFFWFIPLFLSYVKASGPLTTALGSTFTQHAVGSIVWLYTVPMTAAAWWALMPVVVVERLVFVLAQTVVYRIYSQALFLIYTYGVATDTGETVRISK